MIILLGYRPREGTFSYTMYINGERTGVGGVCDDTPEDIEAEIEFLMYYYTHYPIPGLEERTMMRPLLGVTPSDIESIVSPMEQLVVQMAVSKINAELLRQRYEGPDPFELYIADHLTPGAIRAIEKPYVGHWRNPHIVQRDTTGQGPGFWFVLESFSTAQEE